MKNPILATLQALVCSAVAMAQPALPAAIPKDRSMSATPQAAPPARIRITGGALVLTATLEGSAAAADFASLLPLALTLEDYAATEKIAYLPRKLALAGAPAGIDPAVGDLAYYAPWGNLALFYRDAGPARGLVRLGRIDGDVAALQKPGPVTVRIERIDP